MRKLGRSGARGEPESDRGRRRDVTGHRPTTHTQRRAIERDTMTPTTQDVDHPPTSRRGRRVVAIALTAATVMLAACSSGSSSGSTTTTAAATTTAVLVKPQDLTL